MRLHGGRFAPAIRSEFLIGSRFKPCVYISTRSLDACSGTIVWYTCVLEVIETAQPPSTSSLCLASIEDVLPGLLSDDVVRIVCFDYCQSVIALDRESHLRIRSVLRRGADGHRRKWLLLGGYHQMGTSWSERGAGLSRFDGVELVRRSAESGRRTRLPPRLIDYGCEGWQPLGRNRNPVWLNLVKMRIDRLSFQGWGISCSHRQGQRWGDLVLELPPVNRDIRFRPGSEGEFTATEKKPGLTSGFQRHGAV